MYLNYKLYSSNGGLDFMSVSTRPIVFARVHVIYIHCNWGWGESIQLLLGRLMSTYINEYVFELYNFSASVPESYIAQMVDTFCRWPF